MDLSRGRKVFARRRAPVPAGPGPARTEEAAEVRSVVRVPRTAASALSRTLVQVQGVRDAKNLGAVRVQVDPVGLV